MNEWVGHGFVANLCFWAVAWVADCFGIECVELGFDRVFEDFETGSGEVGASDGAVEEGVSDEGVFGGFVDERDTSGGVTRGVGDCELKGAEGKGVVVVEVGVGGRSGYLEAEGGGEVEDWVVEP